MAKHSFGILQQNPPLHRRYDEYEPEKYGCIYVDDALIEPLLPALQEMDCFWHTLRQPGNQKDENYPFILFFSLPFVNYIHIRKPADAVMRPGLLSAPNLKGARSRGGSARRCFQLKSAAL